MSRCFRWMMTLVVVAGLAGPMTGCATVFGISEEQEISLGQQAAPKFLAEGGGHIPDPQVHQYATNIFQQLLAQVPPEEMRNLPWEFHTLDSGVINAFALPGGKVFITRGLMARLDNEAQLAGVIGHEIGHVIGHHINQQIARQRGIGLMINVAGAVSDSEIISAIGGGAGNLYLLSFGRGQELDADQYGIKYMARAGYNPIGMRQVMQVLAEAGAGGGMEMLSTHPHPETRIDQADELLSTQYANTQNNPQYVIRRDEYHATVLERLKTLPPPKDSGKK